MEAVTQLLKGIEPQIPASVWVSAQDSDTNSAV